jgi:hypothetical protein
MPVELAARSIVPVEALITRPAVAVKVPPACPVIVTGADPDAQLGGEGYDIVAEGSAMTTTDVVAELEHPDIGFVKLYVTVYVPGVLVARFMFPVVAAIFRPDVDE